MRTKTGRACALGVLAVLVMSASGCWQQYVIAPTTDDVRPKAVVATTGNVTGAANLLQGGTGGATLTFPPGGTSPSILLDFGQDVAGVPTVNVTAASGSPVLRTAYAERLSAAGPAGDGDPFIPLTGVAPHRFRTVTVNAPGPITDGLVQGGLRYQWISLDSPGTVTIAATTIHFAGIRVRPSDYQGWFSSSSPELDRLFYSGAYTVQLNMLAPGVQTDVQAIVDGSRRDRMVWATDLNVAARTTFYTLGSTGSPFLRRSIEALADPGPAPFPAPGALAGYAVPGFGGFFYSTSYSMQNANLIADYVRYTGDMGFAASVYPLIVDQLDYDETLVDGRGLLITPNGDAGRDWNVYDGPKAGAVTAYNAIYHRALREGAYLATHLGDAAHATAWNEQADDLADAMTTHLWNPTTGVFDLSDLVQGTIAQDANAAAIVSGLASDTQAESILDVLEAELWGTHGALPFSPDTGYEALISPYATGLETAARFERGDDLRALDLINRTWAPMLDKTGPTYSGAVWENMTPAGTVVDPRFSLAHSWASGPTWQMAAYVLGAQPIDPGFATWRVQPHLGSLTRAEGRVPTPHGPIDVRWTTSPAPFHLVVTTPGGTSGVIAVPVANPATATVTVGGVTVWQSGAPAGSVSGISAVTAGDGSVELHVAAAGTYDVTATG